MRADRPVGMRIAAAVAAGVAVTLAWHAALFATDAALPPLATRPWPDLGATVVNVAALAVPLGVIAAHGWWDEAWLRRVLPARPHLLLPALAAALLPLSGGLRGAAAVLLSSAGLYLALGMSEELTSRGVVQRLLGRLPPVPRALWVGLLFGLGHGLSAAWFGRPVHDAATQIVSATTFGVGYAALRMHIGTIWPLALLHGLDDWTAVNSPRALPASVDLVLAVVWLLYGLQLARRSPGTPGHRPPDEGSDDQPRTDMQVNGSAPMG